MKKLLLLIAFLAFGLFAVVLVSIISQLSQKEPTSQFEIGFRKGVSYSPKSLTSVADINDFWEKAVEAGEAVRSGGDWIDFNRPGKISSVVTELAQRNLLVPVIEVNFFNQESGKLLRPLSSANKTAYRDAAVAFAQKYQPPYFGIGVEIDTFYRAQPDQFDQFAALFNEVYDAVKAVSPHTIIFTTFQYERLQGLWGGLFGGTNDLAKENWDLLAKFPKADLVAFTTYPGLIYKDPRDIPNDYYSRIKSHTEKPVAFTEMGWFSGRGITGWESSEGEQARFIARFFELTEGLDPQLAIWLHLYQQAKTEPFGTMSLFGEDGQPKDAWDVWVKASR